MHIILFSILAIISISARANTHFDKVIWIILENEDNNIVKLNPIFKDLADKNIYFSNMFAVTHPSQGNYVSMIAGSTYNIKSDDNIDLNEKHLGDLLEAKGFDWKVYAENYPGNCFLDRSYGNYARKHVPFLSFRNVSTNFNRCLKIESTDNFESDLKNNKLPEFTMYIPNLMNDGHNSGLNCAANWLNSFIKTINIYPLNLQKTLIIINFDEGSKKSNNQIFTVLMGKFFKGPKIISRKSTHYTLLKLIEDEFLLGDLGKEDSKETSLIELWN